MSRFQTFIRCAVVWAGLALTAERTPAMIDFFQDAVPAWHYAQPWLDVAEECTTELQVSLGAIGLAYAARLRGKGQAQTQRAADPLECPLLMWPSGDIFTTRMALEGVFCTGATGAGKTSTTGAILATAYLNAGWGGVVLTAKRDERNHWIRLCQQTNRLQDLVIFDGTANERFNPLAYEFEQAKQHGGLTQNIVHLVMTLADVADPNASSASQKSEESFWRDTSTQAARNTVDLLALSGEEISSRNIQRVLMTAPPSLESLRSPEWRAASYCFQLLERADGREHSPRERHDLGMVLDYFTIAYPELNSKTRSIIVTKLTATLDFMNRGLLFEITGTSTTTPPSAALEGKILLFDTSIKEYGLVGKMFQCIAKTSFQRTVERRNLDVNDRPVFLYADECQHFITGTSDREFLATCRSSRCATLFLTQNLGGLQAALGGGSQGEAEAAAIIGNLNSKVIHANSDGPTNLWAADLIGKSRQIMANSNQSRNEDYSFGGLMGIDRQGQSSTGFSESLEYVLQPADFSGFRTGGPANGGAVDAVLFQTGRRFASSGMPFTFVTFQQALR